MDQAVELLLESLETYSPSKGERRLSSLIRGRMRDLGFEKVRSDSAGNAIGEVGKGKPHLLLCGHMDTVPGMLKVRLDDERIYGRGAADAKSAMCAMVTAASLLEGPGLHVTVACVTREESDSLGVNTVISDGGDYDYAVFGEPSGAGRVTVGYRGRVEAVLSVRTEGGHAGSSWARPSAFEEALTVLESMRRYERSKGVEGDHYRSLNITPTLIRAGTYPNVVPQTCRMTLDVRIPPGMSSREVIEDLTALAQGPSKPDGRVASEAVFREPTEPYEAPVDSVVVRAFQRSIIRNLSSRPILTHKTGTGDMNTLAGRMGIPCVTYGPGDPRLEHTSGEYVEISDYMNSIKVLRGVLSELSHLHRAR